MTTVADLFGDLSSALDGEPQKLPGLPSGLLPRQLAGAVAAVLDHDIGALALDGWLRYDELRRAARRTAQPGAAPERVRLAEHAITSTHTPVVEIYQDDALVATIRLGLEVAIDVHVLDVEVESGRLSRIRAGDLDVRATLSIEGYQIAERKRRFDVGALISLHRPIALGVDDSADHGT